jgi:hypothetical protein
MSPFHSFFLCAFVPLCEIITIIFDSKNTFFNWKYPDKTKTERSCLAEKYYTILNKIIKD